MIGMQAAGFKVMNKIAITTRLAISVVLSDKPQQINLASNLHVNTLKYLYYNDGP